MIPFSEQLTQIRNGDLDEELSEALAECVKAVDQQGGTAALILKISVKRSGQNTGYVKVSASYTTKLPKQDPIESILYAAPDGALLDDNPKQGRMFAPQAQIVHQEPQTIQTVITQKSTPVIVDRNSGEIVEIQPNLRN